MMVAFHYNDAEGGGNGGVWADNEILVDDVDEVAVKVMRCKSDGDGGGNGDDGGDDSTADP